MATIEIRVVGVPGAVMHDEEENDLPGAAVALGAANDTDVSKVSWLSDRRSKNYDSLLVELKRASQARRFLDEGFFYTARSHKSVPGVLRKATITETAPRSLSSVYPVAARTNRSAKSAGCSIPLGMSNTLRIIQLNVQKRGEIHDSLMNDDEIADAAIVVIQEPHANLIQGRLLTTPKIHHKWTKLVPTICNTEGRWAIRSILWVRRDLEVEQVPIESSDLTAAVITLLGRKLPVVFVYVKGVNAQALTDACGLLRATITKQGETRGKSSMWSSRGGRKIRLPRNNHMIIGNIADLAKCISIMPASGTMFIANAPLLPVFFLGLLATVEEHVEVANAWFEQVIRTPVRSSVPPLYGALDRIQSWMDREFPLPAPNVEPLRTIAERQPWWEIMVAQVQ
ncbi:hypothetical protein ARSEF4850_001430 [Beauveria asiatica]